MNTVIRLLNIRSHDLSSGNVRNLLCLVINSIGKDKKEALMLIKIACDYEWKIVNRESDKPYKFSDGITSHMKAIYKIPAIYRWVIDNEYYVGETVDLCRRIENCLNAPEPKYNDAGKMLAHQQTTNINLNARMHASTNNCIELLELKELQFGDAIYKSIDLTNKNFRLMLEKIAILDHVAKNKIVLNKC